RVHNPLPRPDSLLETTSLSPRLEACERRLGGAPGVPVECASPPDAGVPPHPLEEGIPGRLYPAPGAKSPNPGTEPGRSCRADHSAQSEGGFDFPWDPPCPSPDLAPLVAGQSLYPVAAGRCCHCWDQWETCPA